MKRALLLALTLISWMSLATAHAQECNRPGASENTAVAQLFLNENKNKDGIITTESGLQYKVITPGTGEVKPRSRGTVSAHYDLYNISGDKLESSRDRRAPLQFGIYGVIAGWQEVLVDMTAGERRMLFVPAHLAYGCKGSAPNIGPNELLIFDMELLHVLR